MAEEVIGADAQILGGEPRVRGTRLSVEFLLELAASGQRGGRFSHSILSSHLTDSLQRFGTRPRHSRENTPGR